MINPKGEIWKKSEFKDLILEKFPNALMPHERKQDYNLLSGLSVENKEALFTNIPRYCNFQGGLYTFNTIIRVSFVSLH